MCVAANQAEAKAEDAAQVEDEAEADLNAFDALASYAFMRLKIFPGKSHKPKMLRYSWCVRVFSLYRVCVCVGAHCKLIWAD